MIFAQLLSTMLHTNGDLMVYRPSSPTAKQVGVGNNWSPTALGLSARARASEGTAFMTRWLAGSWEKSKMAINQPQPQSRWHHLKGPIFFIAALIVVHGLLYGGIVCHKWQQLRVQTVSARLTSSGDVIWGDTHVAVDAMQPRLQHSADMLRSHGFKPRLLIEHYRDTQPADIAALTRIGHAADFESIETEAHDWASPKPPERED